MLSAKASAAVTFDDDEIWRVNRVQVALILHIPPAWVDDMSEQDVSDVLNVHEANKEIDAWRQARRRRP